MVQISTKTPSLWSYVNSQPDRFLNPFYSPGATLLMCPLIEKDDAILYPDPSLRTLRLWEGYHLKWYYKLEAESSVSLSREKRSKDTMAYEWKTRCETLTRENYEMKQAEKRKLKENLMSQ